jgi:general secretion pathway protein K
VEGRTLPAADLPLVRLDDLRALPGFDAAIVARLEPFVTVIPFVPGAPLPSLVNLNTAPAEVIAAVVPGLELAGARRFVERRERSVFRSLEEASQAINGQPVLSPLLAGVGSNYFLLRGMVRFDRVEVVSETLLSRASGKIEIVWQQRL